jgi:hypothetical protein
MRLWLITRSLDFAFFPYPQTSSYSKNASNDHPAHSYTIHVYYGHRGYCVTENCVPARPGYTTPSAMRQITRILQIHIEYKNQRNSGFTIRTSEN